MRKPLLVAEHDLVAAPVSDCAGAPLSNRIEGQNRRRLERRREECARRVRLMMIEEVNGAAEARQLRAKPFRKAQLQLRPYRHGLLEEGKSMRREGDSRLQQAFELDQRPLVKRDRVQLAWADAGLAQAVIDRLSRKSRVVLGSAEPLFLHRSDDLTIPEQCRCRVVVKGRDAEDVCHRDAPCVGGASNQNARLPGVGIAFRARPLTRESVGISIMRKSMPASVSRCRKDRNGPR